MAMPKTPPKTIAAFIAAAPAASRPGLKQMLACIRKAAPGLEECIAYGIPSFKLKRYVVHFSGWEKHIGFYPGAKAMLTFKKDLAAYKTGKGSVQFPLGEKLPLKLVAKITKHRLAEELKRG
jgi:uncharacterized protein YdhG (YjbR/CyaY superfamily)